MQERKIPSIPILIVSALVCVYAIYEVHFAEDLDQGFISIDQQKRVSTAQNANQNLSYSESADTSNDFAAEVDKTSNEQPPADSSLPIDIELLFTQTSEGVATFISGERHQIASIEELLFDSEIKLTRILEDFVVVEYKEVEHELYVAESPEPNTVVSATANLRENYLTMSAENIGTQPRIIEHIVSLTPTPFIADGLIANVGMSPKLFNQAGLRADDVIKKINGKNVANEQEFSEFQRQFQNYDTLVFEVERKGRNITLYLDIPGDSPTIIRQ